MPASSPDDARFDPSDEEILAAARSVRDGAGVPGLADYVERLFFVSDASTLDHAKLRFLFGYWNEARARSPQGRVAKQAIDVVELKVALGNLLLLDVERDGLDARYRVYGTNVADHAGRDWTGYRVSEMNREARTPVALLYRACYRAVWESLQPLYSRHKSLPYLGAKAWQRLILPLCDADGRCVQFLVGNLPVEPKPLSYEERADIRKLHRR